ncbi:uncharacterized protein PHACADRAFT_253339 [Phanerochaete carnosa HHB-10118-sp]|uniref:tRNA ligase n=1 Tax=Phanerochaete carnosa (strain HHB-10118-sp) TaxID=650164 RepID=K5WAS5_PHACS|nr:uncharacterized protein PHACADRAFT_253339 [Phanerochaete carnosa HHB-10118-sp]EKM56290.1 hypothetical protein PHACADRAFT_253339 [Phanerochaete carnosa HHB-10118-sp]
MNEFKYYDIPSPFPTLARGLFTRDITVDGEEKHRIVARGYDKFFNIGEVPWTTWGSLEAHTKPPYTLTLKSNGCIIFISALTPTKLLVTSKHSLGGKKDGSEATHAQVGERWLRKHLSDAGKTEEQLAQVLWEKNWTAVAELCDDSFEEHVLPYSKEQTGLHLHGINECRKEFRTMLQETVDGFAREWGFITTQSIVLKTIPAVKEFTEEIGKAGKWRGQALEGFVVRTHVSASPSKPGGDASASPYAPGSSFFFKVKFDEPYMMYRDWREVTKTLLSKGASTSNVSKAKLKRPETQVYVKWVIKEIKRERTQFAEFTKGKGIIATRERFLNWLESGEGQHELDDTSKEDQAKIEEDKKKFGKTIIVPIAIPGVGKTTIAIALAHLFNFGHTQSDDIASKKAGPQFVKNVVKLLQTHDVVIADKNNHLRQHRQALRDATKGMRPPVRLLAFDWSSDLPPATVHRICGDRIVARGENHQTLRADVEGKAHDEVVWMFLSQTEELLDNEVDELVEMSVEESLEDALARAVDACVRILGVPRPSAEQMGQALAAARGYSPTTRRETKEKKEKARQPRYYALIPEIDLERLLGKRFKADDISLRGKEFYRALKANDRVTDRPHITIVHEGNLPAVSELWERTKELHALAAPPLFSLRLSDAVWNDRVMALVVEDVAVAAEAADPEAKGAEFLANVPEELRSQLHVTVGTKAKDIKPVEARDLVEQWKRGETGIESCKLDDVFVKGRIRGLFN